MIRAGRHRASTLLLYAAGACMVLAALLEPRR